jgi:hypothetical protein
MSYSRARLELGSIKEVLGEAMGGEGQQSAWQMQAHLIIPEVRQQPRRYTK